MKRCLGILALCLVVSACGGSVRVTPSRPEIVPRVPPSPMAFRFSVPSNREFARHDAEKLIRIVVVPHRARRVAEVPKSAPSWFRVELSASPRGDAVEHRIWVIHEPLKDVVRFVRTHWGPGPRPEWPLDRGTTRIGSRPGDGYQFPPVPGRSSLRWLNVRMLALPSGATVITAQAGDSWIHPPPRSAELPRGVKRIDITSRYYQRRPSVRLHVRDRYDVGSIVSWMNGLGVSQFHGVCFGGIFGGPVITLTFRAADGKVLARGTPSTLGCGSFSLTVRGRTAPPLIVGDLFHRIEQRLGADLTPPLPRDVARCLGGRGWHVHRVLNTLTARKKGQSSTITFLTTGKVTRTGPWHLAIGRCLRSSPRFGSYG